MAALVLQPNALISSASMENGPKGVSEGAKVVPKGTLTLKFRVKRLEPDNNQKKDEPAVAAGPGGVGSPAPAGVSNPLANNLSLGVAAPKSNVALQITDVEEPKPKPKKIALIKKKSPGEQVAPQHANVVNAGNAPGKKLIKAIKKKTEVGFPMAPCPGNLAAAVPPVNLVAAVPPGNLVAEEPLVPKKVCIKPIAIQQRIPIQPIVGVAAAAAEVDEESEENDDNIMVRKLRVMGTYYWVGVNKPYIYDLKTKKKLGFIREDFFIDWFISEDSEDD